MSQTHRTALNLLKLTVSLSLIVYLVSRMDIGETWSLIGAFDVRYLGPILLLSLSGILVNVYKWSLILKASGLHPPLGRLLRLFWIGTFFNNFLPGRTGGDAVRAYGIARNAQNRIDAALSVVIDRGLNLMALLGIALLALRVSPGQLPEPVRIRLLYGGMGIFAAGLLLAFVLARFSRPKADSRIGRLLGQARATGMALLRRPAALLTAAALSGVYQATMILSNYGVARGLGLDVAPGAFFYLIPITALITMLPVSLNGLGLREGAYALAFAQVGTAPEAAVSVSIVATLCMVGLSLIGGIFYVRGPVHIEHHDRTSASSGMREPISHLNLKTAGERVQK